MGGHNYVLHGLYVAHPPIPASARWPHIPTLPFHNVIISFSMVSFFTKPRGVWGTVRVELTQAPAAHTTASQGLCSYQVQHSQKKWERGNGKSPDDPVTMQRGTLSHRLWKQLLDFMESPVHCTEIRFGCWLLKRHIITRQISRLKAPKYPKHNKRVCGDKLSGHVGFKCQYLI